MGFGFRVQDIGSFYGSFYGSRTRFRVEGLGSFYGCRSSGLELKVEG